MNFDTILCSFREIWKYQYLNLRYKTKNIKCMKDILDNCFLNDQQKQYILQYLIEYNRYIFLSKKYYYKWRRFILSKKDSTNLFDLELNPIKDNSIILFDFLNNKKYTFSEKEIIKLIENNFYNSHMYEPEPIPTMIKNPYTNLFFTKYQLKDIDKQLREHCFIWECYKHSNWSLNKLLLYHYSHLKRKCIENYVYNLNDEDLKYYIDDIMIFINDDKKKICNGCLVDFVKYRDKNVKRIIIEWVEFIKKERNITEIKDTIDRFYKVFNMDCSHKKKIKRTIKKEKLIFPTLFKYVQYEPTFIFFFKGSEKVIQKDI